MTTASDARGHSPLAGAIVLLVSALAALAAANSPYGGAYHAFWRGPHPLPAGLSFTAQEAVDQGLMTLFFLVVGLELKHEITHGALRRPRAMILPLLAALGGMLLPALVYYALNPRGLAVRGWGVPMSTDIAFAVAALAALGHRVPRNLLIFVLALAIIDDIGAILVIAVYYSRGLHPLALAGAALAFAALVAANRRSAPRLGPTVVLGAALWVSLWSAGIDPPLAGVLIAAALPGGSAAGPPPERHLERRLTPPVRFGVLPLFALANAGLPVSVHGLGAHGRVFLGVLVGLLLGKFVGVGGVSWLALRLRLARLPSGVTLRHVWGAAWLGGIGFTMALLVNALAFPPGPDRAAGKLAILVTSPCAFVLGTIWLLAVFRKTAEGC